MMLISDRNGRAGDRWTLGSRSWAGENRTPQTPAGGFEARGMNVTESSPSVTETLSAHSHSLPAPGKELTHSNYSKYSNCKHTRKEPVPGIVKSNGDLHWNWYYRVNGLLYLQGFVNQLAQLGHILIVFHLFVVCGAELCARSETTTNATAGEQVLFPIEHQGRDDRYDVTFRLRFPLPFKILAWKSNNPEKLDIVHPLYEHRAEIRGQLVMLYDVQVNDTGEYEIQIDYYGTELKNRDQSTFRLQVFEPVSQPVAVILGNCAGAPNITLSCSVSKGTHAMIHWEKVSLFGVINETYDETVLVIDCVTEEEQQAYRCTARNPVSNATSNRVIPDLHNGTNPNGTRNRLMVLFTVVLLMAVLAATIGYRYKFHGTTSE